MKLIERIANNRLTIFLFHGVIEKSDYQVRNYTRKHIEKDYFYRFIKRVKKTGSAVSMNEVVDYIRQGKPFPARAFAVTFDDGFENNYSIAATILRDLNMPATFYLTTDFIENNHMSWIDRIEYCLENTRKGELTFPWSRSPYVFKDRQNKIRLLDYLRGRVKCDPKINLDYLASDVFRQCGIKEVRQSNSPLDLKMNWEQVKKLKEDRRFIIGGHSHHHLNLAFLSRRDLESEIKVSIRLFKEKAGIDLRHYSYPEGLNYCYSARVITMLKKYGIVCCPTAEGGRNKVGIDLFRLKRVVVV